MKAAETYKIYVAMYPKINVHWREMSVMCILISFDIFRRYTCIGLFVSPKVGKIMVQKPRKCITFIFYAVL